MKRILAAFDKFKGSLDAQQACDVTAKAVLSCYPDCQVTETPLTDGGEGFCEILTNAAQGRRIEVRTLNARFEEKPAHIGMVQMENLPSTARETLQLGDRVQNLAIVEMAQASDLAGLRLDQRDPWEASSAGTGLLLREAANIGADAILLGIGGSATNDMGMGALEALGTEYIGEDGVPILQMTPKDFARLDGVDLLSNQLPLPPIRIACDVENPLLGDQGATCIFGPQKGLRTEHLSEMESALILASEKLCEATGKDRSLLLTPGAGAAGGLGIGLMLAYDAEFLPGFDLVSQWLDLPAKIQDTDLLLTGEGSFDQSSLLGKGPWALVQQASRLRKPVQVHAGKVTAEILPKLPENVSAFSITPEDLPLAQAMEQADHLLHQSIVNNLTIS